MKFKYCELVLVLLMMSCSSTLPADFIVDNFENQSVDSGLGTPLDYFSFGKQLADRGARQSHVEVKWSNNCVESSKVNAPSGLGVVYGVF